MVDSHCHLNFHAFEKDVDEVIKEAFDNGVKAIINVGTKIDSSEAAIKLAEKYKNLYATVGIHPHHADKLEDNWLEQLESLAKSKKVIAIGECGLDYFHYESNGITDKKLKKELFEKQIELSIKSKLPLMIHNRLAGDDILEIVGHYKNDLQNSPGMFHCFSGDADFLKKVLDLGFYIGFDGNITYKGRAPGESVELSDLVRLTPAARIITETDSPYLSPIPLRGSRNTPKNVIIVGKYIAELKNINNDEFSNTVDQNFKDLFKVNINDA